jgi:hypothetical protein
MLDQFCATVKPGRLRSSTSTTRFVRRMAAQQLAFWNAHHDERGFASMHIYHVASGAPVANILRPARTPKGTLHHHLEHRMQDAVRIAAIRHRRWRSPSRRGSSTTTP